MICCRYLAQRPPDGLVNTRLWWKAHAVEYPKLALMFHDIGAIPGSSAPCERIFSGGADLVNKEQAQLRINSSLYVSQRIVDRHFGIAPSQGSQVGKQKEKRKRN